MKNREQQMNLLFLWQNIYPTHGCFNSRWTFSSYIRQPRWEKIMFKRKHERRNVTNIIRSENNIFVSYFKNGQHFPLLIYVVVL